MAISEFATYINPLILALRKLGGSARADEVCNVIAEALHLPDAVRPLHNSLIRHSGEYRNPGSC